jgi:hypothetical protein
MAAWLEIDSVLPTKLDSLRISVNVNTQIVLS